MSADITIELSLFIEHGREQEAANFYASAFGAEQVNAHYSDGVLNAVDLRLGSMLLSVTGSNPKREQEPALGGPFFPKAAGAVSAILRLNVGNFDQVLQKAIRAGATVRDAVQADQSGRRIATVFDPFCHIWALVERSAEERRRAA